ncbi:conjugal transfer protein TraF [Marinobacter sp.]|jgi:hypothetical protein|uniref:conjugal transfer protein TraF n=1 Tax=Marinobacter sp. TaxID=50741 RepID=UPI0019C70BB5|nr:conjugal transfer protein TraF [Marinobacter sp.]MBC7192598.1 conjugal transfer protein TraF [Marinobacter sp.]
MKPQRLARISLAIALASSSTAALASPSSFMSARSFAMGGTGVAVSHPVMAGSSNPAMLASDQHEWADDFGMVFPIPSINARYADEEEAIDQVDDIQDLIDTVDQQIATLESTPDGASIEALGASAADLRDRLVNFNKDNARVNAGLGLGFAVPGKTFSVGVVASANLTATVRGELDKDDEDFLNDVVRISQDANSDATTKALALEARINAEQNAEGEIQLDSRGRALASAVAEVGISFAHALQLNNGQILQLGITPKYVELRTFQYTETVSDFEEDELDNDQYQTDKSGFNLDIGAAYAFGENNQWNAGLVVKNLIPMELDSAASRQDLGEKVRTLELNPMVTAGIAHKSEFHVLTAELDLTKNEAFGFEDDTQWLALGAEFDAWRWAQLRAGVRHNLASNDDNTGIEEKTQFTAGLGLNVFGLRADLGGMVSDADLGAALEIGFAF